MSLSLLSLSSDSLKLGRSGCKPTKKIFHSIFIGYFMLFEAPKIKRAYIKYELWKKPSSCSFIGSNSPVHTNLMVFIDLIKSCDQQQGPASQGHFPGPQADGHMRNTLLKVSIPWGTCISHQASRQPFCTDYVKASWDVAFERNQYGEFMRCRLISEKGKDFQRGIFALISH